MTARCAALNLLVALGLALAAAGCAGGTPAVPPPSPTASEPCAGLRTTLGCGAVQVDGVVHRYALTEPPAGAGGGDVVLVDLGGPGRALAQDAAVTAFARSWRTPERLLFVEEPWVTRPLSDPCRQALGTFYVALRSDDAVSPSVTGRLTTTCELGDGRWGWTPQSFASVVAAVLRQEHLRLVGAVADSFGATRIPAVWTSPDLRWIVLNSPAPLRMSARDYLDRRRLGAMAAAASGCRGCDVPQAVTAAARDLTAAPVVLEQRTPPVAGVDVAAAVLSLPYLPDGQRADVAYRLLHSPTALPDDIGRMSDGLLLRYGDYEMSPAVLAYLSEICPHFTGWAAAANAAGDPGDPVAALLGRLHSPCRDLPAEPFAPGTPTAGARVCVATADDDYVTPASFADTWTSALPAPERIRLPRGGHA